MKLSIIVPVYKKSSSLKSFLKFFKDQISNNYELIFIIDTNIDKVLNVIDEFSMLKRNIKVIYNSTRCGRTLAIKRGVRIAKGEYSIIMTTSTKVSKRFISESIGIFKKQKSDVIEFNSFFKNPKKFNGKIRKEFNNSTLIKDNNEILAYTYPFAFNKFFKTDILEECCKESFKIQDNSRFSISLLFKILLNAKTYSSVSEKLLEFKFRVSNSFNPFKSVRQWKEIAKYADSKYDGKYSQELMYARYFHEIVFVFGLIRSSKNKVLYKKLSEHFKESLKTDFLNFVETNKYMLQNNDEVAILKQYDDPLEFPKIFKNYDK